MLSPCDSSSVDLSNSFPNDVDAPASSHLGNNNASSHDDVLSSQDQRKQSLVDLCLSTINLDISQPSGALSKPVIQTTISCRSVSSQRRPCPSQHGGVLPLSASRTVAAQAESSSQSLPIATEAQNQKEQGSSQHGFAHVLVPTQNSSIFLGDRVSSTVNIDTHPFPAGDQLATPDVQYPPMSPGLVSNPRPRPAGFSAIAATLAARARGDSVDNMSAENVSEDREHVQIDTWIGDAKTVLIFNGVFIPIVASFVIESYKLLSPNPATSIIIVNVMWLISFVLNIASTLLATSTLMLQTQLTQVPRTPAYHMHRRSYLLLCTLSVFLFLVGLVVFFFIIHKIVGIAVLTVLIAVGLFGMFYLVFRPCWYRPLLPLISRRHGSDS